MGEQIEPLGEEEVFQKFLDEDPTDWQTRMVLADWLDERGDVRGPGYRYLGLARRRPATSRFSSPPQAFGFTRQDNDRAFEYAPFSFLPRDLFAELNNGSAHWTRNEWWYWYRNRKAAEDGLAIAFSKLPPARQLKLLNQNTFLPAQPGG